jgi:hypothetical protein
MALRPRVWIPVAAVGLFAAMQLVRPAQTNPPVTAELATPPEVRTLLRKACYDCHSNESTWPWYSHVAPVSWLVARDVDEGRRELNFSTWGEMKPERKLKKFREIAKEVEEGEMPMAIYVLLHGHAELSAAERKTIVDWARAGAKP